MTTLHQIELAETSEQLTSLVSDFTCEHGCELDESISYTENANWFAQNPNWDGVPAMAEMLNAATARLESLQP